eukprot:TRINITY_DN1465_c1_g1_i2.p1 TRINITY_DN1465_c1_g1~~TRINITY_DN1465_c1_g1_i2.p1  ORF type:complete len:255 (+),score=151.85 TRINITY_DN1465_c1_g1_i2:66-830(+)
MSVPSQTYPLTVIYCAICGFPPEYCSFSSTFERCRAWFLEQNEEVKTKCAPSWWLEIIAQATTVEPSSPSTTTSTTTKTSKKKKGKSAAAIPETTTTTTATNATKTATTTTTTTATATATTNATTTATIPETATATVPETATKNLAASKSKKKEQIILISRVQRNKKKSVTVVTGLDGFGVKHRDAAKLFANRFSCGASVVKAATQEEIDIQGDFCDEVAELISTRWPEVPTTSIYFIEEVGKNKQRVPAFPNN